MATNFRDFIATTIFLISTVFPRFSGLVHWLYFQDVDDSSSDSFN